MFTLIILSTPSSFKTPHLFFYTWSLNPFVFPLIWSVHTILTGKLQSPDLYYTLVSRVKNPPVPSELKSTTKKNIMVNSLWRETGNRQTYWRTERFSHLPYRFGWRQTLVLEPDTVSTILYYFVFLHGSLLSSSKRDSTSYEGCSTSILSKSLRSNIQFCVLPSRNPTYRSW